MGTQSTWGSPTPLFGHQVAHYCKPASPLNIGKHPHRMDVVGADSAFGGTRAAPHTFRQVSRRRLRVGHAPPASCYFSMLLCCSSSDVSWCPLASRAEVTK